MKKKSFLLLIFFFAILFAIVIIPNKVFATNDVITEVRLTMNPIKVGNTISTTATIEALPEGSLETDTVILNWCKSENSSGTPSEVITSGTFEADKYYWWGFDIQPFASGYITDSSTKFYVNGTEYEYLSFVKPEKIKITEIRLTGPEIKPGNAIPTTVNIETVPAGGFDSTTVDVYWLKSSNSTTSQITSDMQVTGNFESGKYYILNSVSKLTLKSEFENDSNVDYYYNGVKYATLKNNKLSSLLWIQANPRIVKYNLSAVKKSTEVDKVASTVNKTELVNQNKTEFINAINTFKTGKENVTDLSDDVISKLFTENKYAVITAIKYKDASYKASDDLIAIGDLSNWDSLQIAQGYLERTDNYEIEYTEVTIENYTYKFISGDNQEFTMSKINEFTFRIDGDYSLFESLKVGDLTLVKGTDYIVTEGSTIITFTETGLTKLNTLVAGIYDVTVKYTDNTVTGKLIVKEETKQEENKTSENKTEENNTTNTENTNIVEENNTTNTIVENKTNNPKTGDTIMLVVAGLVLSIAGIYVTKKL